jgi:hypothetical protein
MLLAVMVAAVALVFAVPRASAGPADGLASGPAVHRIRIVLGPDGTAALRSDPRGYVRADVEADGEMFRGARIHLKGSTGSFRKLDEKPSLTIDLGAVGGGRAFRGGAKFHLDNSVEDPSYLCGLIGGEIFRSVGIPAPEVSHARVVLDGRDLGLYVLVEGFTPDFLQRSFAGVDGALLEPGPGQDIDGRMQVKSGKPAARIQTRRRALAAAASETDPSVRWRRLEETLDVDRFITSMAVEVLIGHRDGYALARNNFRLHIDIATGKAVFLPQGMDQLFAPVDLPLAPQMAGSVARAVMDSPEGRRRYQARIRELAPQVLDVAALQRRVDAAVAALRASATRAEMEDIAVAAAGLIERIRQRAEEVRRLSDRDRTAAVEFIDGVASLAGWEADVVPDSGRLDRAFAPDATPALHIVAGPVTSAAWRTTVRLPAGRYRLEGRARTAGVTALPFGSNHGAVLRIGGGVPRSSSLLGDSPWSGLAVEFEVGSGGGDVLLLCELRASRGEAWFDAGSLRLRRLG